MSGSPRPMKLAASERAGHLKAKIKSAIFYQGLTDQAVEADGDIFFPKTI